MASTYEIIRREDPKYTNYGNKAAVNNADLDPIQGFDTDVYVIDQATGLLTLMGRFVSIQYTVQNNAVDYLELNQRNPRYLDGAMRIGFVLERGLLDARVVAQTFGYSAITRDQRVNRMPRFQITFSVGADDLNNSSTGSSTFTHPNNALKNGERRNTNGELVLTYCVMTTLQSAARPGGEVVVTRWEGMAEGIETIQRRSQIAQGAQLGNGVDYDESLTNSSILHTPFPWDGKDLEERTNRLFGGGL